MRSGGVVSAVSPGLALVSASPPAGKSRKQVKVHLPDNRAAACIVYYIDVPFANSP
jgi:hypothetical protein